MSRKRLITAKFEVDGKTYSGRWIDIDTLEHLGFDEKKVYEFNEKNLFLIEQAVFTLDPESFEFKFTKTLRKYFQNQWPITEKQNEQYQKLAHKYCENAKTQDFDVPF